MIPFNVPYFSGQETTNIKTLMETEQITSGGEFSRFCKSFLEKEFPGSTVFLTQSATQAIEISAILSGISSGDEVIMPSFTFVSSANPFALLGAKIVFVDICPETMNLNPDLLEVALTEKTKAILPVHYGGVAADMQKITDFAKEHNLFVIEDAAHALGSTLNGKPLGTFGDTACISFHATKNIQCGEGGALIINNKSLVGKAGEIINNGTNRVAFLRGEVAAYTWTSLSIGSQMSEVNAAILASQLPRYKAVTERRNQIWQKYREQLLLLEQAEKLALQEIPANAIGNGHLFYVKLANAGQRQKLQAKLQAKGVETVFHFQPLHLSPAGKRYGRFSGKDCYTSADSNRLLRLPLYAGLKSGQIDTVCEIIHDFFRK